MSNQFSYELDERRIKILMKDAELDYNEAAWEKFDKLAVGDCKQSSSTSAANYIPKFNLNINRSVIVPVLFVVLIGGLSAMLFSFVDFKKKESVDKEIPLIANPDNYKKPEVAKAKVANPTAIKAEPTVTVAATTLSPSVAAITNTTIVTQTTNIEPVKLAESKPIEETKVSVDDTKKVEPTQPIKIKKKKKVVAEPLPTIKVVTNLNEGASEPELDLK